MAILVQKLGQFQNKSPYGTFVLVDFWGSSAENRSIWGVKNPKRPILRVSKRPVPVESLSNIRYLGILPGQAFFETLKMGVQNISLRAEIT